MKQYLLSFLLSWAQTNHALPSYAVSLQPQYAKTELGAPRNPPYRKRRWRMLAPAGVIFFLGVFLIHRQYGFPPKDSSRSAG